jgi:hypothetical protein
MTVQEKSYFNVQLKANEQTYSCPVKGLERPELCFEKSIATESRLTTESVIFAWLFCLSNLIFSDAFNFILIKCNQSILALKHWQYIASVLENFLIIV